MLDRVPLFHNDLMRFVFLLFLALFFSNSLNAACSASLVHRVERYLNSFRNFDSDFEQLDKNLRKTNGSFSMKRPNYMRLEYDRPNIEIIYDRGKVSYIDKELGSKKNHKIQNFILRAILDGKLENRNLSCNAISEAGNSITASLTAKYDVLNSSNLVFVFVKNLRGDLSLSSMENRQKGDNVKINFFNIRTS